MNYYFAYGLTIATDFDFPELHVLQDVVIPDVHVRIGKVPPELKDKTTEHGSNIFISPDEFLLTINNVGSFYACHGSETIIEPVENADPRLVRIFFLSNAMAAILYQRKSIPLHASAIYDTDGIVLFVGDSGAGKSTTVASLQSKGYRIFSDDVCVPFKDSVGLSAYSAYPMMKLWKDTFEKANLGNITEEYRLRPEMEKYGKLFNESFDVNPQKIKKIFVLQKAPIETLEYKIIQGIEAFKKLQDHAYRLYYIADMNLTADYFKIISALSNQIPTTLITRPDGKDSLKKLLEIVENQLDGRPQVS